MDGRGSLPFFFAGAEGAPSSQTSPGPGREPVTSVAQSNAWQALQSGVGLTSLPDGIAIAARTTMPGA